MEDWGQFTKQARICQQDVCSATLYTQTTEQSSSIWDPAATPIAPSQARQSAECGTATNPTYSPSQQALVCPSSWALGVGHILGGGGTKASWFLHDLELLLHESKVCFVPFSPQDHWRTQRMDWWLELLMLFNITSTYCFVTRSKQMRSESMSDVSYFSYHM